MWNMRCRLQGFLNQHAKVLEVSYAGLPGSRWHDMAGKYMPLGPGSVFTFNIDGGFEEGCRLVANCNLFSHLANIGDTRSLILHPASTTHRQLSDEQRTKAGIADNMLRVSIGLEHPEDLMNDLQAALAAI
jgi:O-acetylhomoserine sulfhydrylase